LEIFLHLFVFRILRSGPQTEYKTFKVFETLKVFEITNKPECKDPGLFQNSEVKAQIKIPSRLLNP
jgi:hypothetical protein